MMKYLYVSFSILLSASVNGQSDLSSISPLNAFDFWVGNWEVHWMNPDSSFTYGTNEIVKTLDGKVIQENFRDPTSGFKGSSLSVYSIADSTWHQAWADNAGGYLEFHGIIDGDNRIFQTKPRLRNDTMITQRMMFHSIEKDHFIWNWEISKDKEETWQLVWQIFYDRKQEE